MQGYYRYPTLFDDQIVFCCENDLWQVPTTGGIARRLTSGQGTATFCQLSPDGQHLAFSSTEEGAMEVYVMPAAGGPATQLTFDGVSANVIGWSQDGQKIIFASDRRAYARQRELFAIDRLGGDPQSMQMGQGVWYAQQQDGPGRLLGRHSQDLSYWKRYKGGLAATIWIDPKGDDQWARLLPEVHAGMARPMWIDDRIWFTSDIEGHGNLYSCTTDGQDLTRHTDHEDFYVRGASTDGKRIVYSRAGELYLFDLQTQQSTLVPIEYHSPRTQLNRKFVSARRYLDEYALHPMGHLLAIAARGKAYNFALWEGAVRQTGEEQGVRYDMPRYLKDGERIVYLSDHGGEERLEIHHSKGLEPVKVIELKGAVLGRPLDMQVSPTDDAVIVRNHRYEIVHVALEDGTATLIDRDAFERIDGMSWSSDGRWVAYAKHLTFSTSAIFICDTTDWSCKQVTDGRFKDTDPCFDPAGRYLYFLSARTFNPTYDAMFFDLGFFQGCKPYVLTLQDALDSPFLEKPRPLGEDDNEEEDKDSKEEASDDNSEEQDEQGKESSEAKDGEDTDQTLDDDASTTSKTAKDDDSEAQDDEDKTSDDDKSEDEPKPVEIDFEGIAHRILEFPVAAGSYMSLLATEDRVLYTVAPSQGALSASDDDDDVRSILRYYDLKKRRQKTMAYNVYSMDLSANKSTLALYTSEGLRVVESSSGMLDEDEDGYSRQTGWINLHRVQIEVDRRAEWGQMLREIWRLMREHFWREDMSGINWDAILTRYEPLLDRIATRGEFSDLAWTLQGELGTSHAYEFGGDYNYPPQYRPGFLGADIIWDGDVDIEGRTQKGGYRIERILQGDAWHPKHSSPLSQMGIDIKEGDVILAINAKPLGQNKGVQQRLVRQANREVELLVYHPEDKTTKSHTVKTLFSERTLRYRHWVETRRQKVDAATEGRVGYIHIPDMGAHGFAEFYRSYTSQMAKDALIIDVRYNGGGHVSQLILERLQRKVIGYDLQRHGEKMTYPAEAPGGPLVTLTNEYAGSDGDIFSHCFKLYGMGPLIGKRTWGGVIGIWPRHALVDGSMTTQPEFSFWFKDVGFDVENYGTDPDIEVELPPHKEAIDDDVQLTRAIEEALKAANQKTEPPNFEPFPNLAPKPLPKTRKL